jgi:ubiquinone/menaquinone biosynthesis C-methylase UbiE
VVNATTDRWLQWLTKDRDAGDTELRRRTAELLLPIRDQILDAARLRESDTVLDIGAGDGLVGIGALQRLHADGHVVFNDISPSVIERLRVTLGALGENSRVSFVVSSVSELPERLAATIDAVVGRSVLIYVPDLITAFVSIAASLRSGGRIALWEPVMSLLQPLHDEPGSFFGWRIPDVPEMVAEVLRAYQISIGPSDPMRTLSVAGLVEAAERAGLDQITVSVTASSRSCPPGDDAMVNRVINARPSPNAPTAAEAARQMLELRQAGEFLQLLERAVRRGQGTMRQSAVLLTAQKA